MNKPGTQGSGLKGKKWKLILPPGENIVFGEYRLNCVLGQVTPTLAAEIIQMWRISKAFNQNGVNMQARAQEVVYTARRPSGELAGVTTAYVENWRHDGRPYFFYRTFIRPEDRLNNMLRAMYQKTVIALSNFPDTRAPEGLIIVTENPKLMSRAGRRIFERAEMEYIGVNPKGQDVWRQLF